VREGDPKDAGRGPVALKQKQIEVVGPSAGIANGRTRRRDGERGALDRDPSTTERIERPPSVMAPISRGFSSNSVPCGSAGTSPARSSSRRNVLGPRGFTRQPSTTR